MRLSSYMLPTLKETPAEAQIVSHRLMLRAGMVRQASAGIYSWLPLGLRVLRRIEAIVREEQDRAGALEILMPTIQNAALWQESGRYDDYGPEMLRIRDRQDRDLLYGPTNEEQVTEIFRAYARSYRDVPRILYHIQWKFRDEIRPRFGIMRGREFLMKDAYSFDLTPEDARASYARMFAAYLRTFARLGLRAVPMRAATGPIGGDLSHEFILLADTGETEVFCDGSVLDLDILGMAADAPAQDIMDRWTASYAATDEKRDAAAEQALGDRLVTRRGIEVGHIFYFGSKYSAPMGATVTAPDGAAVPLEMGSYGIGVSRLAGAIIEASHDETGIIWPDAVAPYDVGLINLKTGDADTDAACASLEQQLTQAGLSVLHDDRDIRPGGKFADMDLIGLPWQVVVGPRGLAAGTVEVKRRATGAKHDVTQDSLLGYLSEAA